jgi:ligand-binding SRPBCC domain-containing protein
VPTLERTTFIPATQNEVFGFFSDPANLARITPRSLCFEIVDAPKRPLRTGDRIRYRIRLLGIPISWVSQISEWTDGVSFVDEQERGPYRTWRHQHTIEAADGGVRMHDRVDYELPLGVLGRMVGGWWVRKNLRTIFDFREKAIREVFPGDQSGVRRP